MRELRRNMRVLSVLLVLALLGLSCFFGYTVFTQGSRWMVNQYNPRMTSAKKRVTAGNITDRTGMILAQTDSKGRRVYVQDNTMRRALSQTVGDTMGMSGTGVETFHAGFLYGMTGSIIDRTWQYIKGIETRGDNIELTVDAKLTKYASQQFPSKYEGAIAVINYKTGEVLAMVSKPDYDPSKVSNRKSAPSGGGTAYLNRVLQGQYPPGSTFKMVTCAAALEYLPDSQTRTFACEGSRAYGDGRVIDFGGGKPHGDLSLKTAFTKSCNVTFAGLGYELGEDLMRRKAEAMGFNDNFRFRDLVVYPSSYPTPTRDVHELVWSADGQGRVLTTPLHMAMIAGAIASGGQMMEPVMISQVYGVGGIPRLRPTTGAYKRILDSASAETLKEYMLDVVKSGSGTAAAIKNYSVGGKTGTAQVSDSGKTRDTAWYVGFVADNRYPYAIAVVVEKGGTGGERAAPIAAKVLKKAIELGV